MRDEFPSMPDPYYIFLGGNHGSNNSGKLNQPVSAFKTAHQQLFIDQQNKNRRGGRGGGYQGGRGGMSRPAGGQGGSGEITHASYGGGGVKKCLGTRPGPASGFKPPVKQVLLTWNTNNLL